MHRAANNPWTILPDLRGSETILIADGQLVVRGITQDMLESFGYHVIATTGYTRLESYATDLVLLEVPIWDEHARSALRHIRALSVPIVVAAPLPEGVARQQMRAAGVAAFLSKPFHPRVLAACVRQVLDHSLARNSTKRL